MKLEKDKFVEYVNYVEDLMLKSGEVDVALKGLSADFGGFYLDSVFTILNELLSACMNDIDGEMIGYYMWDLDFGREYVEGSLVIKGENVPLSTPEELYEALVKYNEE